jgi:hypothetical protein
VTFYRPRAHGRAWLTIPARKTPSESPAGRHLVHGERDPLGARLVVVDPKPELGRASLRGKRGSCACPPTEQLRPARSTESRRSRPALFLLRKPFSLLKKRLSLQTKRLSVQTKRLSLQTKRLSVQTKRLSLQTKRLSLLKKPLSLQKQPLSLQKQPLSLQTKPLSPLKKPLSVSRRERPPGSVSIRAPDNCAPPVDLVAARVLHWPLPCED